MKFDYEFLSKAYEYRKPLIDSLIEEILNIYFDHNRFDAIDYLNNKDGTDYEDRGFFWDSNITYEKYLEDQIPPELRDCYLYEYYAECERTIDYYYQFDDFNIDEELDSLSKNIPNDEEKALEEEPPFESTSYVDEVNLNDDSYLTSLLASVPKVKENLKDDPEDLMVEYNIIEKYGEYDKLYKPSDVYKEVYASWLKVVKTKEGSISDCFLRSGNEEEERIYNKLLLLNRLYQRLLSLQPMINFAELLPILKNLLQIKDKSNLINIVLKLENTSDFPYEFLNLLQNNNPLDVLLSILLMKSGINKSKSIITIDAILNDILTLIDLINYYNTNSDLIIEVNIESLIYVFQHRFLSSSPGFLIKQPNSSELKEAIEKGFDLNYPLFSNNNTYIMEQYQNSRNALDCLEYDFDLYQKNAEGLNTLEVAQKYCKNPYFIEKLFQVYGITLDDNAKKFNNAMRLARNKNDEYLNN